MKSEKLKKFDSLVSDEKSSWLEKALWRKANKKWLDQSAKIALNILEALNEKGWSQKRLAEEMGVSSQQVNKIVKGNQNLTFETIAKIETALKIDLVQIIDYRREASFKKPAIAAFRQSTEKFNPRNPLMQHTFIYTPSSKTTIVYNKLFTATNQKNSA